MVHADPVPENVLVQADGRIALLDYGATRTVEIPRVDEVLAGLSAFAQGDAQRLGQALERLGAGPARLGSTVLEIGMHALGGLAGSAASRLDNRTVIEARDRLLEHPELLTELIVAGRLVTQVLWPVRAEVG